MTEQKSTYVLAESLGEVERLQKQYAWFMDSLNNRIVFAPIDLKKPGLRVLDVGCADGTVLRDLQKEASPDAEFVGIDVSPKFLPDSSQGNIRYQVGDLSKPFPEEFQGFFDLTHLRYAICGAINIDLEAAVAGIATTLKPGAWLQIQEPDTRPEPESQGTALADFVRVLASVIDKMGVGHEYVGLLADAFRKAGLENVSVQAVRYPIGIIAGNEEKVRNSVEPFMMTVRSATNASKELNTGVPSSVTEDLEQRFETEMMEKGGYYRGVIVLGQKKSA